MRFLLLVVAVSAATATTEWVSAPGLAALRNHVDALQVRVKRLEAELGTNQPCQIREYTVDTMAGTMKCRSCQIVEDK